MTDKKKTTAITALSYRQRNELAKLIAHPDGYFGSCTNPTMNALERRGIVAFEWTARGIGKWLITEDGREFAKELSND